MQLGTVQEQAFSGYSRKTIFREIGVIVTHDSDVITTPHKMIGWNILGTTNIREKET